ncbi:hypothetical protein KCV01_g21906, partial [Aureobasidium melanogenum]
RPARLAEDLAREGERGGDDDVRVGTCRRQQRMACGHVFRRQFVHHETRSTQGMERTRRERRLVFRFGDAAGDDETQPRVAHRLAMHRMRAHGHAMSPRYQFAPDREEGEQVALRTHRRDHDMPLRHRPPPIVGRMVAHLTLDVRTANFRVVSGLYLYIRI